MWNTYFPNHQVWGEKNPLVPKPTVISWAFILIIAAIPTSTHSLLPHSPFSSMSSLWVVVVRALITNWSPAESLWALSLSKSCSVHDSLLLVAENNSPSDSVLWQFLFAFIAAAATVCPHPPNWYLSQYLGTGSEASKIPTFLIQVPYQPL